MTTTKATVSDRDLTEAVARCVGALVYYHSDAGSAEADSLVAAEAQRLVVWALTMGLDRRRIDGAILIPLESELIARFGPIEGPRLLGRFLSQSGSARGGPRQNA